MSYSVLIHLKANPAFVLLLILSIPVFFSGNEKKACCLLCAIILGVCAVSECLLCNFKAMSETLDVDAVCQIEPYTRAKHEGLQGAWSHKLLPIPFIFKHEKAL